MRAGVITAATGGRPARSCSCELATFFFQAERGIRDVAVTGVQTCALPICIDARLFGIRIDGRIRTGSVWSTKKKPVSETLIGRLHPAIVGGDLLGDGLVGRPGAH